MSRQSELAKKWGVKFTPQEIEPYFIWCETKEQAEAVLGRSLNRAGTYRFKPKLVENSNG